MDVGCEARSKGRYGCLCQIAAFVNNCTEFRPNRLSAHLKIRNAQIGM